MNSSAVLPGPRQPFVRFGLIVTGKGEEIFLPEFFRSVSETGRCSFKVIRRIDQRTPRTSPKRKLPPMVGTSKAIPDKDAEHIGFPARRFLSSETRFVILIDDLEAKRAGEIREVFGRYRTAMDTILSPENRRRASVHFFVNMLEAYYFADGQAVNRVLGTEIVDHPGDVEAIRNPKSELKKLYPGFHEIEHGRRIVGALRMRHVLSRSDTCASLRTMFGWICKAVGEPVTDTYRLRDGRHSEITGGQISALPIR